MADLYPDSGRDVPARQRAHPARRARPVEPLPECVPLPVGEKYRNALFADGKLHERLKAERGWGNSPKLRELGLGWDAERGAILMPGGVAYWPFRSERLGPKTQIEEGQPRRLFKTYDRGSEVDSAWRIVCEGEADAIAAACVGLKAIGVPGAGKWRAEWGEELRGLRVCIIPDADEAGRKSAQEVAASLVVAGATEIRVLDLWPNNAAGMDLTDWILMALKRGAPPSSCLLYKIQAEGVLFPAAAENKSKAFSGTEEKSRERGGRAGSEASRGAAAERSAKPPKLLPHVAFDSALPSALKGNFSTKIFSTREKSPQDASQRPSLRHLGEGWTQDLKDEVDLLETEGWTLAAFLRYHKVPTSGRFDEWFPCICGASGCVGRIFTAGRSKRASFVYQAGCHALAKSTPLPLPLVDAHAAHRNALPGRKSRLSSKAYPYALLLLLHDTDLLDPLITLPSLPEDATEAEKALWTDIGLLHGLRSLLHPPGSPMPIVPSFVCALTSNPQWKDRSRDPQAIADEIKAARKRLIARGHIERSDGVAFKKGKPQAYLFTVRLQPPNPSPASEVKGKT